jgi:hypothetical protein
VIFKEEEMLKGNLVRGIKVEPARKSWLDPFDPPRSKGPKEMTHFTFKKKDHS